MNVKRERIKLPHYSLGEELISSISHGIGALLSIAALVLCIVFSKNTTAVISSVIYGTSLIILYLMSCLYHAFKPNKAKKVFRVFDHSSIFLLIAGSCTPFLLVSLGGIKSTILLIFLWVVAITGIVFNCINLEKYQAISTVTYLLMGWIMIFTLGSLKEVIPTLGINLLLAGGITYTVGMILYGLGNKIKYMHSIWHFFVLGGSILHFFSIFLFVI